MVLFIAFDYHRIDGEEVMKNMTTSVYIWILKDFLFNSNKM